MPTICVKSIRNGWYWGYFTSIRMKWIYYKYFSPGVPLPSPQLIVKSQSSLFTQQSGRQIDLSKVLPTQELFWLNLEEGYFACQLNQSEKFLKIFKISRLCDGTSDCYQGSDELYDELRWVGEKYVTHFYVEHNYFYRTVYKCFPCWQVQHRLWTPVFQWCLYVI